MLHVCAAFFVKALPADWEKISVHSSEPWILSRLRWGFTQTDLREWGMARDVVTPHNDSQGTCPLYYHNASCHNTEYWVLPPPFRNNFVMRHNTLSWGIKSNSTPPQTPLPPSNVHCSIWFGPLMNTASCHLLMELPCLGVHCCDTGSAVAKRLLERLKERINQRLHMTDSHAPRSHIR